MSMLTHEQLRDFIATHDFRSPEDVQRALKGLCADTLQAMLASERETHRGYPKHQAGPQRPRTAAKAGTPSRSPRSTARCPWRSPATATGASRPSWCRPIRPRWSALRTKSSPGMPGGPTRDIQAQLAHLYGVEISPALVSNITPAVAPHHGVAAAAVGCLLPRGVLGCYPLQGPRGRPGGQQSRLHGGGH